MEALTILAILVIVATIPFAIMDTIKTGRVHLFSSQFFAELPRRFTGPGRFFPEPQEKHVEGHLFVGTLLDQHFMPPIRERWLNGF